MTTDLHKGGHGQEGGNNGNNGNGNGGNAEKKTLQLTVQTTKGNWVHDFEKTLKVAEVIEQVRVEKDYAAGGNYTLKIKGAADVMDKNRTLVSYGLKDADILVFTDLGTGA